MRGTITAVHNLKWGNGTEFKRVTFKLEDGTWAKTDLCPSYRNFGNWKAHLKVGTEFSNLNLKDRKTVDADSRPVVVRLPPPEQATLF